MKLYMGMLCFISAVWAGDASTAQIRDAATKAVAMIQRSQRIWSIKRSCFSCHQQVLPALAFRAAREHGSPVDEPAAHADAASAFGFYSNLDRAVQYTHIIDPAMSDSYGLMGADAAGLRPSPVTAVYARSDERPPESYSSFTATAISMAAIQMHSHANLQGDVKSRVARACAWLLSHTPRTTEERTFQIFGMCVSGEDKAITEKLVRELKVTQQPDGVGLHSMVALPVSPTADTALAAGKNTHLLASLK